jgi:hypothetical protein
MPRRTPKLLSVLACVLLVSVSVPATATETGSGDEPTLPLEESAARHSSDLREPTIVPRTGQSAAHFTVDERTYPVAPGLDHTSFDRYDARGWIRVDALTARLATPGLKLDYASPGKVSSPAPLSQALQRDKAVAGVNADFFDIGDTGAPLGIGVDRQRGAVHGPASGWNNSFTVDSRNMAAIARTYLQAQIIRRGKPSVAVTNLNSPTVAVDGIGIFTSAWGSDGRARTVSSSVARREVRVVNGRVRANRRTLSTGPIARDATLLVGTGAGARRLSALKAGQRVTVEYGVDEAATRVAVGGNVQLLRDGAVVAPGDPAMHPRTAIGIDEDTEQVIIVTVDGRQSHSRGITLRETAVLLRRLGAEDALNLDGGGSSTMLARQSGEGIGVVNAPSDGGLRSVPNGLGFAVAAGSGTLTGIRVEPVVDVTESHRVFTGLTRTLVARGHDEMLDPVAAKPRWRGSPTASVRRGPGRRTVVRGRQTGTGMVRAVAGAATGEFRIRVLGDVHRLETTVPSVALTGKGRSQTFEVRGYDARGFSTWVEPRDVRLSYDRDKLRVRRSGRGLTVTSLVRSTSDAVKVTVGGASTYVGVTVGLQRRVIAKMRSLRGWQVTAYPARADARSHLTKDRRGRARHAIALRYSLYGRTATRAAYLTSSPAKEMPGKARRVGMWVRGDGKGAWLRVVAQDSSGARSTINLTQRVTWKGWRFVSAALPSNLAQPLAFVRVYAVETERSRRYAGTLAFDDITVWSERTASVPDTPPLRDPMVADLAPLEGGGLRVAVLADAGISASAPQSRAVARTRAAMQEVVAAKADLVLINGDLVRRGLRADFALARRIIDEELDGKVAWRYLPGDGEIRGTGDLTNFRTEFGAPVRTFDQDGTRFVLMNSAPGTFRLAGFGQLVTLRRTLSAAADDQAVTSVVVAAHHPTSDPTAGGISELADSREGDLVEDLLAEFRATTGKNVAYLGSHARRFAVTRDDDVPHVLTGAVNGAVRTGSGNFAGWTMLRVDTADTWLRAQLRPSVDALRINAPTSVTVGDTGHVGATVTQGGRRLAVRYPMAAEWLRTVSVYVGDPEGAPITAVAALQPESGTLTGLRPGQADLALRINGTTVRRTVTVR